MDPTDEAPEPLLPEPGIASISEALPRIAERFATSGTVGMMLVATILVAGYLGRTLRSWFQHGRRD